MAFGTELRVAEKGLDGGERILQRSHIGEGAPKDMQPERDSALSPPLSFPLSSVCFETVEASVNIGTIRRNTEERVPFYLYISIYVAIYILFATPFSSLAAFLCLHNP